MDYTEKFNQLTDIEKKILDASKIEFENMGYHKASVDEIAKNLQIGKGTIYRHFGTKFKLFISVIFEILSKLIDQINEVVQISDFNEAYSKFIDKVIEANQRLGKLISSVNLEENSIEFSKELTNDEESRTIFKTVMCKQESSILVLKEILERGKKTGVIYPDIQTQIQAEIIYTALNGFIRKMISHRGLNKDLAYKSNFSIEEGLPELKKFLFRSIGLR